MALSDLDNVALYERETLWNWDYREDSYYRTKLQLIGGMIPSGVKTILDVGCGNGAIANEQVVHFGGLGTGSHKQKEKKAKASISHEFGPASASNTASFKCNVC